MRRGRSEFAGSKPGDMVHDRSGQALLEVGVHIAGEIPKAVTPEMARVVDLVLTSPSNRMPHIAPHGRGAGSRRGSMLTKCRERLPAPPQPGSAPISNWIVDRFPGRAQVIDPSSTDGWLCQQ